MATGNAWDISIPSRPVAEFDPNAIRNVPVFWGNWFTDIESEYASHVILDSDELECLQSTFDPMTNVLTMQLTGSLVTPPKIGQRYPITMRVSAVNGEREDQTLYFKMVNK